MRSKKNNKKKSGSLFLPIHRNLKDISVFNSVKLLGRQLIRPLSFVARNPKRSHNIKQRVEKIKLESKQRKLESKKRQREKNILTMQRAHQRALKWSQNRKKK